MNHKKKIEDLDPRGQSKFREYLPWLLVLLSAVFGTIQLILYPSNGQAGVESRISSAINALFSIALPLALSVPAALILRRQPKNRVGWLMMVSSIVASNPLNGLGQGFLTPPDTLTLGTWLLLWLDNWTWTLLIFPIFLIPLYFPDGRPPTRRWNWVLWLTVGLTLFMMFIGAFSNQIGPNNETWQVPNPIGFIPFERFIDPFLILWGILLLSTVGGSVWSLFYRYRRANQVTRDQIKWMMYGGVLFVISYGLAFFLNDTYSDATWVNLFFSISLSIFPVAISIAILRHQLYDINLIIRRTIQYALLTGLLAFLYFGAVVLMQGIFENISGERSSPLITVVSTLGIAALFNPLRLRIQDIIERRFYRKKYDAEQALARFAAAARDEVDVDRFAETLIGLADETMQPETVSLWMRVDPTIRKPKR